MAQEKDLPASSRLASSAVTSATNLFKPTLKTGNVDSGFLSHKAADKLLAEKVYKEGVLAINGGTAWLRETADGTANPFTGMDDGSLNWSKVSLIGPAYVLLWLMASA